MDLKSLENKGHEALHSMSIAHAFNKWMYEAIKPYTKGEILEIGSGIGNISQFFIQHGYSITLSDIDPYYITYLQKAFQQVPGNKKILSVDLQKENFKHYYSELTEKFDTVFLLNVLEHLQDEASAIQNCRSLLKNGGILIILVPAYSILFSAMDKALYHYRRYTAKQLAGRIRNENFIIEKTFYFNALGIPAWLYAKMMMYKTPPTGNMKFFDTLVPVGKILDKIFLHRFGLSAIAIAKKIETKE